VTETAPPTVEELEALIDARAIDVPPVIVIRTAITVGVYVPPNENREPVEDDIYVAQLLTIYDAEADAVVNLPLLYDPEFAVEQGIAPLELVNDLILEATSQLNPTNTEEASQ
jgi:hypothetical protein